MINLFTKEDTFLKKGESRIERAERLNSMVENYVTNKYVNDQLIDLRTQLREEKEQCKLWQDKYNELREGYEKLRKELESPQVSDVQELNEALTEEIGQLKVNFHETVKANDRLQKDINELNTELAFSNVTLRKILQTLKEIK